MGDTAAELREEGERNFKIETMWGDLYTHERGEPVVTSYREYMATVKDRDDQAEKRDKKRDRIVTVVMALFGLIELIHLFKH